MTYLAQAGRSAYASRGTVSTLLTAERAVRSPVRNRGSKQLPAFALIVVVLLRICDPTCVAVVPVSRTAVHALGAAGSVRQEFAFLSLSSCV